MNKKTEMNSTGIPGSLNDTHRSRCEKYGRCPIGVGTVQGGLFQAKGTASVHLARQDVCCGRFRVLGPWRGGR